MESVPLEVQSIRIGDVGIVGLPGEFFVEYGLDLKEKVSHHLHNPYRISQRIGRLYSHFQRHCKRAVMKV